MNSRGASLIEYSALLVVVLVAVLFMSTYVRRAVLSKIHEDAQRIGSRYEYGGRTVSTEVTNYIRNITVNVEIGEKIINNINYTTAVSSSNIIKDQAIQNVDEIVTY